MALFGAPLAHEDHAQRACHAALAIQKAMEDYGEEIKRRYGIPFHLRIGLNSGPVVVGKIGDDLRMDYTAIGDTTNLASRMQSLAQPGIMLLSNTPTAWSRTSSSSNPWSIAGQGQRRAPGGLSAPQTSEESRPASRLPSARGLTRFVGRENPAPSDAYDKVQSGSGQVVGIVGEAGVGKSRLLLEFRHGLREEPLYLEGRCLHYGGSMVYLPFLDILRSYFDIKEGDSGGPDQEEAVGKDLP